MKKRKRVSLILSLAIIVIVLIGLGIGGKKMLDNQAQVKELSQEKQIALQAKNMFKDIKEIRIIQRGEGSPGSIFFVVEIKNNSEKKYKVDLDLNDSSSYSTVNQDNYPFTQTGKTKEGITLIYLSGERENIE